MQQHVTSRAEMLAKVFHLLFVSRIKNMCGKYSTRTAQETVQCLDAHNSRKCILLQHHGGHSNCWRWSGKRTQHAPIQLMRQVCIIAQNLASSSCRFPHAQHTTTFGSLVRSALCRVLANLRTRLVGDGASCSSRSSSRRASSRPHTSSSG